MQKMICKYYNERGKVLDYHYYSLSLSYSATGSSYWSFFFFVRGFICFLSFQLSILTSLYPHSSVRLSLGFTTMLIQLWLPLTSKFSASPSSNLVAPSRLTQAEFLLSSGFLSVMVVLMGMMSGRKLREWGARGVKQMH